MVGISWKNWNRTDNLGYILNKIERVRDTKEWRYKIESLEVFRNLIRRESHIL